MSEFDRRILDSLMPGGSAWSPAVGGGLDLLLDGIAARIGRDREFLSGLSRLRDPASTPILSDLERELGVAPNQALTDGVRRQRLQALKRSRRSDGALDTLAERLTDAGFDLQVHANDPPADPAGILQAGSGGVFGNDSSVAGNDSAYFGVSVGELLVNGPLTYQQVRVQYPTPAAPEYWPLVFFVGGAAERGVDGGLLSVAMAQVPGTRRVELRRLLLTYKPMATWVGLRIEYT